MIKKSVKTALLFLYSIIFYFIAGVFAYHKIVSAYDSEKIARFDVGSFVEVENLRLNYKIFNQENTSHTIVLMPGLNVSEMALSFKPLADKIDARIILINRPGYGLAQDSNHSANVDYIIDLHRKTLQKLGIAEKVILMPHSISGMYAMYWAEKYPDEIEGIIALEAGSPYLFLEENVSALSENLQHFAANLGLHRLALKRDLLAPTLDNYGFFSSDEFDAMFALNMLNGYPAFAKNEAIQAKENAEKVISSLGENYHKIQKTFISADYGATVPEIRNSLLKGFGGDEEALNEYLENYSKRKLRLDETLNLDENTTFVTAPGTHAIYLYPSAELVDAINSRL